MDPLVLTLRDWGNPTSDVQDEVATDKRAPMGNADGPVYGVSMTDDLLLTVDPRTHPQHCPEGWTLHAAPGPQIQNAEGSGSADFYYYNWVDQFNTLGLGENLPIPF